MQDGVVLVHTTQGELLRSLPTVAATRNVPSCLLVSRECLCSCVYNRRTIILYSLSGYVLQERRTDVDVTVGIDEGRI